MNERFFRPTTETSFPYLRAALEDLVQYDRNIEDKEKDKRWDELKKAAGTSEFMALADKWGYGDLHIRERMSYYKEGNEKLRRDEIARNILQDKGIKIRQLFYQGFVRKQKGLLYKLAESVGIGKKEFDDLVNREFKNKEKNDS